MPSDSCTYSTAILILWPTIWLNFNIHCCCAAFGGPLRKLAITPPILRAIRTVLDLTMSFDATFWAACLVAFYSFFRKANLLPQSKEKFDDRLHLRRNDFSLFTWGAVMTVRWNKTIQFRQRTLLIPLPRVHSSPLCPLTALLHAFHHTRNADPYGPAFTYSEGSMLLPLTYNKFQSKLKMTLRSAGIDTDKYSGHSFRRGGATYAMRCGIPVELTKAQGDWKSNAYERYLDNAVSLVAKHVIND